MAAKLNRGLTGRIGVCSCNRVPTIYHATDMNRPDADWDKLARHVAGELSLAESAEVKAWLAANPGDAKAIAALAKAIERMPASAPVDVEAALLKVKTRLRPATPWRTYVAWAAAAAIVVAVGVWRSAATVDRLSPLPVAYSTD